MESGNGQGNDEGASNGDEGAWLIVICPAGKFACRTTTDRSTVDEIHREGGFITAEELLDFATPAQMVPSPHGSGNAIVKAFVMTRLDATTLPVKADISLNNSVIYYLDDLKLEDRMKYLASIRAARNVERGPAGGPRIVVPGMSSPPGFGRGS